MLPLVIWMRSGPTSSPSNADSTFNGVYLWEFNRLNFFAREYTIEISAREWLWVNVSISIIVLVIILFAVLIPIRKGRTA